MPGKAKNSAAVALGRKGGKKGGPARAAKMTAAQRSASARHAVRARWAKARNASLKKKQLGAMPTKRFKDFQKQIDESTASVSPVDSSDRALLGLLKRLKTTKEPAEVRQLSDQLERVIFHKQYAH